MQIGTNVASLFAQRSLHESSRDMGTAMERLSTGSKVNSASDDAAGLAMSSRLTGQIGGLDMAAKNITDGVALTQAIEGSLDEANDLLQRMRSLAVQAASDTVTNTDRTLLNNEMVALKNELTAMSSRVKFNDQNVLDGSYTGKAIQVGANANETISLTQASIAASAIGAFTLQGDEVTGGVGTSAAQAQTNGGTGTTGFALTGNGTTTDVIGNAVADTAKSVAAEVNALTASTGISATALTKVQAAFTNTQDIAINGTTISQFAVASNATILAAINEHSATTGVVATDSGVTGTVILTDIDGDDITIQNLSANGTAAIKSFRPSGNDYNDSQALQNTTGNDFYHGSGTITLTSATTFSSTDAEFAGGNSVSSSYVSTSTLTTQSNATSAISVIDGAINRVASMRADLGAIQNRLEHALDNTLIVRDSATNMRSKLVDADMSVESANLARAQVLQQVGTAMLAQANAQPQLVLQLLQ